MTEHEFLSHFQEVKKSGSGYIMKCPAHDDHDPSLSVKFDGDKILLNCFAECETEDILKAVGLKLSDLYMGDKPKKQ